MNAVQLVLSALILLILFGLINLMINYISRRDGERIVPFRKKLWLIPLLSAFIIIPLELFAMLYAFLFPMRDSSGTGEALAYDSNGILLGFSLIILIGFLIFESLIHPLFITILRLILRRDASIYIKQAVTIAADTVVLYLLSLLIPAVPIDSWLQALSIALFFHFIEWILIAVQAWTQHLKRSKARSAG